MNHRFPACALFFWAVCVLPTTGWAQMECRDRDKEATRPHGEQELKTADALPPDQMSETRHVLRVDDTRIEYLAVAGILPIQIRKEGPECRMFFIFYTLPDAKPASRPMTFVFNGGPGASSAYLHLGAIGPKIVEFGRGGAVPDPPPRLADNTHTWLRFTDLVFVDPVGTGYSRCLPAGKGEKKEAAESSVWGVEEDFTAVAKFIRLYLTRKGRWLSPKFLAGESYGGFRVAALSERLQSDYGIGVNGMILISTDLEFGILRIGNYRLLSWIAGVPSYAATARRRNKAQGDLPKKDIRKGLDEVEHFAVNALLPSLAAADPDAVVAQLANFMALSHICRTGLPS